MKKLNALLLAFGSFWIGLPFFTGLTFMSIALISKLFAAGIDWNWSAIFVGSVVLGFLITGFTATKVYFYLAIKNEVLTQKV